MSEAFNRVVNAVSAPERPIYLLTIDHEALDEPIRIVNDTQDLTSNGHEYTACGIAISLPTQPDSGAPKARLGVDNTSRELVAWLEATQGGSGATVTIQQVLRSDPNTIEFSTTLDMSNVEVSAATILADLAYDDVFNQAAYPTTYNTITAPGLF